MAAIKVYQYDYFDRLLKCERRSVDFATAEAIAAMGATILAESVREVDEDLLDARGVIRGADLPPRIPPEVEGERGRQNMRGGERRAAR